MRRPRYTIESGITEVKIGGLAPLMFRIDEKEPVRTNSGSQKKRTSRKVRWAKMADLIEIPHLKDIDEEDIDAAWMSAAELKEVKHNVKETVLMMMGGKKSADEDDLFCSRGLEHRTKEGCRKRYNHKTLAWDAVLNEQYHVGIGGDPVSIAVACMRESMIPRLQGYARGKADEECIQEYVADIRISIGHGADT